ncbi:MAG: hypothetical protein KIS61_09425 [Candidatus Eremiobacteraeota bacterium]|nr:hypothetical protein [Candidatus Eremiobacteraeota bacterium]
MAWKKGSPKQFGQRLKNTAQAIKRENTATASKALTELEAQVQKRAKASRRVNKQDNPRGTVFNQATAPPISGRTGREGDTVFARVTIRPFWTGARSQALKAILTTLGLIPTLFRRSLLVIRGGRRGRAAGRAPQRIHFRRSPQLARWAARADKGSQYLAHVTRLKGEALRRLVAVGAVKAAVPKVLRDWRQAMSRALGR